MLNVLYRVGRGDYASEIANDDGGFVDLGLDTLVLGCFRKK